MASKLLIGLAVRLINRRRQAKKPAVDPAPTKAVRKDRRPTEQRLTADPQLLNRIVVVRRGTVVLRFEAGKPPRLCRPGQYLIPAPIPQRRPVTLVVINTEPTTLAIRLPELMSLDRRSMGDLVVRLVVRLHGADDRQALVELAADHGTRIEEYLLERTRLEITAELGAVVTMNRADELVGTRLDQLVQSRLPPRGLAGGVLAVDQITVGPYEAEPVPPEPSSTEPERPAPTPPRPTQFRPTQSRPAESRPTASAAAARPAGSESRAANVVPGTDPEPASEQPPGLDLLIDPDLARIWQRWSDTGLFGIAGARSGTEVTVIAIPQAVVGAYAESRIEEHLRRHYGDRPVKLVIISARSYQDLLRSWVGEVDAERSVDRAALRTLLPVSSATAPDEYPRR